MADLPREELIETGRSVPTGVLANWVSTQLGVARKNADRLKARGIEPPYISEIESLFDSVRKLQAQNERTGGRPSSESAERVNALLDQAVDYWREIKQMAKVEFAGDTDALAGCRTGVKVGPSIRKLADEIARSVSLLRAHRDQLGWLGVNDAFIGKGETLLGRLREEEARQREVISTLPEAEAELFYRKGRLLDLTRKLVRVGRLEFRNEPKPLALFNYDALRAVRGNVPAPRARSERTSAD